MQERGRRIGRTLVPSLACALVVALACSEDEELSPCVDGDLGCGRVCGEDTKPCTAGLYCSPEGKCSKQCSQLPGYACESPAQCTLEGRCVEPGAGTTGTGGGGATGARDGGFASGDGAPGICADTVVNASMVTPTVILIVDQSGSMNEAFQGGSSRWDTLKDFLLQAPDGLIADLQSQVRFGLALYSARSDGDSAMPVGECPLVTVVAPAIDNYAAIEAVYRPEEPIDETPTGDAIDKLVQDLGFSGGANPSGDPVVFILATDGEPDRCEELNPQNGQAEAIAAVERAFALGIRTFIISVGEGTVSAQHQQDVANAGLGRGPGDPDAEYWVAGDDASLRAALTQIVGGQLGCEVQLNGSVAEKDACLGVVKLNDRELECGGADGWEWTTPRTIRLNGAACDELKTTPNARLEVRFPCGVAILI